MIGAKDRTDHTPAALARPKRTRTTAIVLHRTINVDANKNGSRDADDVFHFFTRDPEGVATVTIGGPYLQKKALIEEWKKKGIPAAYQGRGFCPYHVLVDVYGRATLALGLDLKGAHAGPWNDRSVAVAVIADPRTEVPPQAMIDGVIDAVAQLLALYPGADVVDHDFVNRAIGAPAKHCIGEKFPLAEVCKAAFAKVRGGP